MGSPLQDAHAPPGKNLNAPPLTEYASIDRQSFQSIQANREPAVFRGLAADWPSVTAAVRSDDDLVGYLRRFASSHPVTHIVGEPEINGRFLYTDDLQGLNFSRGMAPLAPFLDWLMQERDNPAPHAVAVQSQEVPTLLPGFERENRLRLLEADVTPRAWIGNRIRVAPHFDLTENIGVVVGGRRTFTLFPPEQLKNLYVGPIELTPAGTPVSLVDTESPDLARFPKFSAALAHARTAELGPGDAIYIPSYWWHGVDSLAPVNLFINYWWSEKPPGSGSPYDALMYAFYAIKVLPPEQRAVWRTIFDHYIFEANGDPGEHLPEAARGVLGTLSPAVIARMANYIRLILSRFEAR